MTHTKPIPVAMFLAWMSCFPTITACRVRSESSESTGLTSSPLPLALVRTICDGKRYCDDFNRASPEVFFGALIGLTDWLPHEPAVLFGSWSIEDAASRPFEWAAEVRVGGVFPSRAHMATNIGCFEEHREIHSPAVAVAIDPDGFAWARLEGDDVFIPFHGKATIDGDIHATAALDRPDAAAPARVTVSVDERDASPTAHGGLASGDTFPWGAHRATIVRIVTPQDSVLGAIGWVEIRLADGAEPGRDP